MDTKRLFIGMAVAMLLVMGWAQLVQYLHRTNPDWDWGTPPPVAATQPAETPAGAPGVDPVATTAPAATRATVTTAPSGVPAVSTQTVEAVTTGKLRVIPAAGAQPTLIGSAAKDDPAATMLLDINPRGAGLDSVVLNEFKQKVESEERYTFQKPFGGPGDDETRALSTRSITVGTETVDLRTVAWRPVEPATPPAAGVASATYRVEIGRGSDPVLRIDKTYTLTPKSADENSPQGYEVILTHRVTNLTKAPLDNVKLTLNGPTPPPVETDNMDDRQVIGGYLIAGHAKVQHELLNAITKESPTKDFSKGEEGQPLMWVGMGGVYFNALFRPDQNQPVKIETATAVGLNFDKPQYHHVILKLETNTFSVPAEGAANLSARVFFGPKKRQLLRNDYYEQPLINYDETLVMTSGPCAYCTIQWLVNSLYYLLRVFEWVFKDWGLAIICLVLIVRAILHPITKKSQINMSRMSKMGPEIERLKKKYGDNKDELNKAMMQFYKQQGATPILGCLPMVLQMPIWIALYSALQSTFELRQAPFLWGFTWIKDLAHADRAIYFPNSPINLFFFHVDAINVLPLIMGVVSYIQAKIMQAQQPPSTTPEQETQKKMMVWMSLLLPVILYNGPSGLNLYIITSTTIGLWESHVVRKHIKQRDELEKQGAIIVDGPPPDKDKPAPGTVRRKQAEPEKPAGGLAGWISKLQSKAEEMQRDQAKRTKKKK